jgi:hypothetical protein
MGWGLNDFQEIREYPVWGDETILYGHDQRTINPPWHKKQYIWFKGGDLNGFRDLGTLPVYEGWDHSTYITSDVTWNKNTDIWYRGWDINGF